MSDLYLTRGEFERYKMQIWRLMAIGFALMFAGGVVIYAVRTDTQSSTKAVACQGNQALVTQYEFFKRLTMQNPNGNLSATQIKQRITFYNLAESLIPAGLCDKTLPEMQAEAAKTIGKTVPR